MSSSQGQLLTYMPQLDALRAFAAIAVLIRHFAYDHPINNLFAFGFGGVRLFYVLSGFLITAILLKCKEDIDSKESSLGFMAKQFYARRFLRIFPVYYLLLAIVFLLNAPPVRESIAWHFFYLSNVFFAQSGTWEGTGAITHFWSLAVEEQFYLVWPWLIFATPARHLKKVILASIIVGPLYRLTGVLMGWNKVAIEALMFGCIDALGFGALLAYVIRFNGKSSREYKSLLRLGLWVGLPASIFMIGFTDFHGDAAWLQIFKQVILSLLFLWIVAKCADGVKGPIGKILELPPFLYLGKISYGIYLYHFPVLWAYTKYSAEFDLNLPDGSLGFLYKFLITLVISSLSWHLFEGPINTLKKHFRYKKSPQH